MTTPGRQYIGDTIRVLHYTVTRTGSIPDDERVAVRTTVDGRWLLELDGEQIGRVIGVRYPRGGNFIEIDYERDQDY